MRTRRGVLNTPMVSVIVPRIRINISFSRCSISSCTAVYTAQNDMRQAKGISRSFCFTYI
jgi:hypothetical protein